MSSVQVFFGIFDIIFNDIDKKDYPQNLLTDLKVRDYIRNRLSQASVSRIEIERPAQTARITVYTARPGIVIGKKGEDVDRLRREVLAA